MQILLTSLPPRIVRKILHPSQPSARVSAHTLSAPANTDSSQGAAVFTSETAAPTPPRLTDLSAAGIAEARLRENLLLEWAAVRNATPLGKRTAALRAFCEKNDVSEGAFRGRLYAYKKNGLAGLVRSGRSDRGESRALTEEHRAYFNRRWLRVNQPPVAHVYYLMASMAATGELPPLPTIGTLYRYAASLPPDVVCYCREGRGVWDDKFAPYMERAVGDLAVNEVWVGDHHKFDQWIVVEDETNPAGVKEVRPWLTAWYDPKTNMFLGWNITAEKSASSTEIALTLRRGIQMRIAGGPLGKPQCAYIDNGKDYICRGLERVYCALGIRQLNALPYNARAKEIERTFKDVCDQFSRHNPGYCGNSPQARDRLQTKLDRERRGGLLMDLATIRLEFQQFLDWRRVQARKSLGGKASLDFYSPDLPRLVPDEFALALCLNKAQTRTVRRGCLTVLGQRYDAPQLNRMNGASVEVRYDPEDLDRVAVIPASGASPFWAVWSEAASYLGATERDFKSVARKRREMIGKVREYQDLNLINAHDAALQEVFRGKAAPASAAAATGTDGAQGANVIPLITPLDGAAAGLKNQASPAPAPREPTKTKKTKRLLDPIELKVYREMGLLEKMTKGDAE